MFKSLHLENYKAFEKDTEFRFAPITLIYGQNSAGKSSVLNSLNLLKQTRMSRDQGSLLLPRAEGGIVDLGSFNELLHDHDTSNTLSVRLDFIPTRRLKRKTREKEKSKSMGIKIGFRRKNDNEDVSLDFIEAFLGEGQGSKVIKCVPVELSNKEKNRLRRIYPFPYFRANRQIINKEIGAAKCTEITNDLDYWRDSYKFAKNNSKNLLRNLREMSQDDHEDEFDEEEPIEKAYLDSAIEFYSKDFTIDEYISRRVESERGKIVALDGFLPIMSWQSNNEKYPEFMDPGYYRMLRRKVPTPEPVDLIHYAGRELDDLLDRLFPLGPYRRAPERLYIFTGTTPADVGYSGRFLPDLLFRRQSLIEETNKWLKKLDIGYEIMIDPVGNRSNDLFEVRLRDTRRDKKASIALPDVGFGISQILPFIVQVLASEEQTITIEQPEVHIHPKLQSDIGDLLISGIKEQHGHRFIVETHSEHIVLRLLRRIRETTEGIIPDEKYRLTADELSVIYLKRGKYGVEVFHLRVDENGEFIDKWPDGFFEERAEELF